MMEPKEISDVIRKLNGMEIESASPDNLKKIGPEMSFNTGVLLSNVHIAIEALGMLCAALVKKEQEGE